MLLYLHMNDPLHSGDGDIASAALWRTVWYSTWLHSGYTCRELHWVNAQLTLVAIVLITVINYLTRNSLKQEVILTPSLREQPRR